MPMAGELSEVAERVALVPAAGLFRDRGDVGRLVLLCRPAVGGVRVVDLVADVAMAQSTALAHLGGLRACGLVPAGPSGEECEAERLRRVRELPVAEVVVIADGVRAGRTEPLPASLAAPVQPASVGTSGAFR